MHVWVNWHHACLLPLDASRQFAGPEVWKTAFHLWKYDKWCCRVLYPWLWSMAVGHSDVTNLLMIKCPSLSERTSVIRVFQFRKHGYSVFKYFAQADHNYTGPGMWMFACMHACEQINSSMQSNQKQLDQAISIQLPCSSNRYAMIMLYYQHTATMLQRLWYMWSCSAIMIHM